MLADWQAVSDSHGMQVVEADDAAAIELTKSEESTLAYNDGVVLRFETAKPRHVRIQVQTTHPEDMEQPGLETCDLRLTTVDDDGQVAEDSDVLLYRMGLY